MERIVCIIQARMGSSRLPGKVLKDIGGKPMLGWVVERVRQCKKIDKVVVATTSDAGDDPIVEFCRDHSIGCFRGDVFDVLDRYYQAAREYKADVVVRVTADCPLIDPAVVDRAIAELQQKNLDFTANRLPPPFSRTFPIGLDVEVASMAALSEAWKKATEQHEREHVMPYLYAGQRKFKTGVIDAPQDYGSQRWTVDTPEDLEFLRGIARLLDGRMDFTWEEILKLVQAHPELSTLNAAVQHKFMKEVDVRAAKK